MVEPIYASARVRLYGGDIMDVLEALDPRPAVGVVLTDPPYIRWKHIIAAENSERLDLAAEKEWMAAVFNTALQWIPALRCLRPGVCWIFAEPHYLGFYLRVARYLRWPMVGWWDAMREGAGHAEYLVAFSDWWAVDVGTWATVGAALVQDTYGQGKSPEMLAQILRVSPAGPVLDPFMGSGTTIEAALRCGRSAIGIEMAEAVLSGAVARIKEVDT